MHNVQKIIRKHTTLIILGVIVIGLIIGACLYHHSQVVKQKNSVINIILSPHFDDAVLSLGGMLAQSAHPAVVATFFTDVPETATSTHWDKISGFKNSSDATKARIAENTAALKIFNIITKNYDYMDHQYIPSESVSSLETSMAQDIQALISSYEQHGVTINVYGPAYFGSSITHPDHMLLHKAYIDVARDFPQTSVQFFIYEDFPYITKFNQTSVISLKKNLENETNLFFEQESILLSQSDVSKKITSIKKYTSQVTAFKALGTDILSSDQLFTQTRCGSNPNIACEVVYKILGGY